MNALHMKRATDMQFRDPRELTPASYTIKITHSGQALDMKGRGAFKIKNEIGCTFGKEQRFKTMITKLKQSRKIPGPGMYEINQIMDRWRRERPCSTKIQKPHIRNECFYDVINGQLVLQPSIMTKEEKKLLDDEAKDLLRTKPYAKRMGMGFVYQQAIRRSEDPTGNNRPLSAQPLQQKQSIDHWTARMAKRSHNFSRRFSESANFSENNRTQKKRATATETREPTVKFDTNVTKFEDHELGASDVDLTAIKASNKLSDGALTSMQEDGEILVDETRNSTTKMNESNILDNIAINSRSQQSLLPKASSGLRTSGYKPTAWTGEGQDGTVSEVQIGGLLNQISEKESLKELRIQDPSHTAVLASRNKVSSRLYFSERPTSATNSKTAARTSTKSQKSNLPKKKLREIQIEKRRRTQPHRQYLNSRATGFDKDRGYFRDILSTNSFVEYNLAHPVNLSLSCLSSHEMEKPFLAASSDRFC